MKLRLWLILTVVPTWALDNGVRLYETAGVAQTAQPRTIHRFFAEGEFPSGYYPKPRAGGAIPAAWQVDVKTRWPDGSVQAAFVSLPVSIVASSSVVVDFVKDANPCHLGNLSTCQAAALGQQAMLDFDAGGGIGSWGATIEGTAGGATQSASARAMLMAGAWSYFLQGPVVTRVIAEDLTRPNPAYDFGWQWNGSAWVGPPAQPSRSIHPVFSLSFYPGWAGVEVEVIAEQSATTRFQRQVFDLAVKRDPNAAITVYSKVAFDLPRGSAFTRYFWDGTAPGAVQVDFNLKYMVHSKITPPLNYSAPVPATHPSWTTRVTGVLNSYNSIVGANDPQDCNPGLGYCGNWQLYQPGTGARGDIAVIPQWYVLYLFVMGDTANYNLSKRKEVWDKLVIGNADAAQTMTIRYLEYDNSAVRDAPADGQRYYLDAAQTTPAFGHIGSTYARPEWITRSNESTAGADAIVPVCAAAPCDGSRGAATSMTKGWVMDVAHYPSAFAMPYVLTGRYSYLRAMLYSGSFVVPGPTYQCHYWSNRCYDWGLKYAWENQRSDAWAIREIGLAALLAPDSVVGEKGYFKRVLEKNDEFYEGVFGYAGGNAQATGAATECAPVATGSTMNITHTSTSSTDWNGWGPYKLNGVTRVLGLPDPIKVVNSITVDGAAKTVGVKGVDSGKDWYYTPGGIAVYQDPNAAPVAIGSTVVVNYTKGADYQPKSPWCAGRHIQMKGLDNPLRLPVWANASNGGPIYGPWQFYYSNWVFKYLGDFGSLRHSVTSQPIFSYTNREMAKWNLGFTLNPGSNRHFADYYIAFAASPTTHEPPKTWAEHIATFAHQAPLVSAITSSGTSIVIQAATGGYPGGWEWFNPTFAKIESEWVRICSSSNNTPASGQSTLTVCARGRGVLGTQAASHGAGVTFDWDRQDWNGNATSHSYPNLFASTLAMYEEYETADGTGRKAWDLVMNDLTYQDLRSWDPQYSFVPRDRITNATATPGTGTLALRWVAPSGAACRVYVGASEPASSNDSGDAVATVKSREQSYSASGLPAGTVYYRISCGTARVNGTAVVQ